MGDDTLLVQVLEVQARTVQLKWAAPVPPGDGGGDGETPPEVQKNRGPFSYELSLSSTGKDGKYKAAYR